jgi:hypothetical protein
MLRSGGMQSFIRPARSPNLNAFAERVGALYQDRVLVKAYPLRETSLPANTRRLF